MTDPTFLAAFDDPRVQGSDRNRAHCLRCHAPTLSDSRLDAKQVLRDDRIAPGETRDLVFEFTAPDEKILVEVNVWYVYEAAQSPERSRREPLSTLTKVVNKPGLR